MLTKTQIEAIERDGFVTVDTPFTPAEVAAAARAADAVFGDKPGGFVSEGFAVTELVHVMFHPFIEAVACAMLRTDDVILRATAVRKTPPTGNTTAALEGEHADIRFSAADLNATPRNILCTILIWLTDVTEKRAPFMYRPGSINQLAAEYQGAPTVDNFALEKLPRLNYAEPVPVLARAGQISVGSTGSIHSGSHNIDTSDRKVIFTQWQARTAKPVTFPEVTQAGCDRCNAELMSELEPSRRHLLKV